MSILKKATLATVLGATALTAASPAMADSYRGYHRGGDTTGAAVAGGIIGLALGAIIASSANNHNDRYVDRGWTWRDGYYWDREGHRYSRDGRRYDDRDGYYNRRGYDDRGYGQGDRGYYGERTQRYGY
jgi:hypothetical protein